MNIKKIKTEYLVLGIVIILLAFYLVVQQTDKLHYRIPRLESLNTEAIDKLEIARKNTVITLALKDGKWLLGPKTYLADADKMKSILDTIAKLSLTEMISESQNYTRYGLGPEEKIGIKAYKGDRLLREFEIGKPTATNGHTFVKLADNPRVYHARESFRNYFDQDLDEFRDKTVMKFDKNEITEIEIVSQGKSLFFTRKAEKQAGAGAKETDKKEAGDKISWVTPDGQVGEKEKVDAIIDQLSLLQCVKYLEDKPAGNLGNPVMVVRAKGSTDYTLTIFEKIEKEADEIPAISSQSTFTFLIPVYKLDNFTRNAGEALKKNDEKK